MVNFKKFKTVRYREVFTRRRIFEILNIRKYKSVLGTAVELRLQILQLFPKSISNGSFLKGYTK